MQRLHLILIAAGDRHVRKRLHDGALQQEAVPFDLLFSELHVAVVRDEAVEQHLRRDAVERLCQVASDPFELQIAQPEDRDQLSCGCVPLGLGIFESHLGLIDFDFEQQRVAASSLARRLQARGGLLRLPRDLD